MLTRATFLGMIIMGGAFAANAAVEPKIDTSGGGFIKVEGASSAPQPRLRYSADGKYVAVLSMPNLKSPKVLLGVYEPATGKKVSQVSGRADWTFQFLGDGGLAISDTKTIKVYKPTNLKVPTKRFPIATKRWQISPDGQHILTVDQADGQEIAFADYSYDSGALSSKATMSKDYTCLSDVSFGRNDRATASSAYFLAFDSSTKGQLAYGFVSINIEKEKMEVGFVKAAAGTGGAVMAVDRSEIKNDMVQIYVGHHSGYVERYHSGTGLFSKQVGSSAYPSGFGSHMFGLGVSPDGKYVATLFESSVVVLKFVEGSGLQYQKTIKSTDGDLCTYALSPDSQKLALGCHSGVTFHDLI
jgi:hypothetical protein